jgi:hypothetical protein
MIHQTKIAVKIPLLGKKDSYVTDTITISDLEKYLYKSFKEQRDLEIIYNLGKEVSKLDNVAHRADIYDKITIVALCLGVSIEELTEILKSLVGEE